MSNLIFLSKIELFIFIFIGGLALLGLRISLKLSMNHYLFRGKKSNNTCKILLNTKQAFIWKIPVSFFVSIQYILIIFFLTRIIFLKYNSINILSLLIMLSFIATIYYSWLYYFKLKIKCSNCVIIQSINIVHFLIICFYNFQSII